MQAYVDRAEQMVDDGGSGGLSACVISGEVPDWLLENATYSGSVQEVMRVSEDLVQAGALLGITSGGRGLLEHRVRQHDVVPAGD